MSNAVLSVLLHPLFSAERSGVQGYESGTGVVVLASGDVLLSRNSSKQRSIEATIPYKRTMVERPASTSILFSVRYSARIPRSE